MINSAVKRAEAEQRGDCRAREHSGALAGELAPLRDLGLCELDLLADQCRGLAREILDQLAEPRSRASTGS